MKNEVIKLSLALLNIVLLSCTIYFIFQCLQIQKTKNSLAISEDTKELASLVNEIDKQFSGKSDIKILTNGDNSRTKILEMYNKDVYIQQTLGDGYKKKDINYDYKLLKKFTLHDDENGYLWFEYVHSIDEKHTTVASNSSIDLFMIKKENNIWKITDAIVTRPELPMWQNWKIAGSKE